MGRFLKTVNVNGIGTANAFQLPKGTSAERPGVPKVGDIRFNTDTTTMEFFDGASFKSQTIVGNVTPLVDTFTGDGTETAFTMTQAASEVKQIMVFVGGVHQDPSTAYGVSTTTITFTSAVPNGELVNVVHDLYSTDVT